MGFDEELSLNVSKQYNNIDKCVQFIINENKKNNKNLHKTDDIKQDICDLHADDNNKQKSDKTIIKHQVKIYNFIY